MQRIVTALAAMLLVVATVATAAPVAAQQRSSEPGADQAKPAQEQAKPESEKKPADRAVDPAVLGLPVNVRLEITITDQRGGAEPIVKTVTKTVADRSWIRIRTGADVQTKLGFRPVVLNIDSFPRVIPIPGTMNPSNKLKVELTIDYRLNAFTSERWECGCGSANCEGSIVSSFFALSEERQQLYLPYAPPFIRQEYRRRRRAKQPC